MAADVIDDVTVATVSVPTDAKTFYIVTPSIRLAQLGL